MEKNTFIYFDSGTGGGKGTRARVTNYNGDCLLHFIIKDKWIDRDGNVVLPEKTNNYGELYACYLALNICLDAKYVTTIYGDSSLVLNYWSKNIINRRKVSRETVYLSKKVSELRKEYEDMGGKLKFISGKLNPADLGYH